ncbi:MAG: hypothetical protein H6Q44_1257, partial [Deltaproteobacteria bacterium]|nr:hypothetical protein [Deltaproteobacteria bacterium]
MRVVDAKEYFWLDRFMNICVHLRSNHFILVQISCHLFHPAKQLSRFNQRVDLLNVLAEPT